jgi:hypothetical protein
MLQSLLSAIVETLFTAIGHATLKFFRVGAGCRTGGSAVGLGCIVNGFTIFLLGH